MELDANLMIDRVQDGKSVGTVSITTLEDGSVKIASTGRLPGQSIGELRQVREGLRLLTQTTQQNVSIEHNGRRLADVRADSPGKTQWSIQWFSLLRSGIDHLLGRDRP